MGRPGKIRCTDCGQWVCWVDAVCWHDRMYCPECGEWQIRMSMSKEVV